MMLGWSEEEKKGLANEKQFILQVPGEAGDPHALLEVSYPSRLPSFGRNSTRFSESMTFFFFFSGARGFELGWWEMLG